MLWGIFDLHFNSCLPHEYQQLDNKTISGKSARSSWDKRQATLILYIYLIVHGTPRGTLFKNESHPYHSEVTVEFNQTAYNNNLNLHLAMASS